MDKKELLDHFTTISTWHHHGLLKEPCKKCQAISVVLESLPDQPDGAQEKWGGGQRPSVVDLGWANGWASDPPIVKRCKELKHNTSDRNLDRSMHGLHNMVRCDICGYIYHYDSSD